MKMEMKYEWMAIQWKKVCFGGCISIVVTMALTGAFAGLVSGYVMEEMWLTYAALGIVMLSSFLGAGVAGGGGQILNQFAVGFMYWVMLLAINAILFEGNLSGLVPTLIAIVGGCAAASLVLCKGRRTTRHRKRRYRHR